MIFVTVGAQMGFDRLVKAVDEWAEQRGRSDVFAQIGPGEYIPRHVKWTRFMQPPEFTRQLQVSTAIVAHAGTGSILNALENGKPILVLPRQAALRETRNDHQIATAQRFLELGKVVVAFDEKELPEKLDQIDALAGAPPITREASPKLIGALRSFIAGEDVGAQLRRDR